MIDTETAVEEGPRRDQEIAGQSPIRRRRDPGGVTVGNGHRIERKRAAPETDLAGSAKKDCARTRKGGAVQVQSRGRGRQKSKGSSAGHRPIVVERAFERMSRQPAGEIGRASCRERV